MLTRTTLLSILLLLTASTNQCLAGNWGDPGYSEMALNKNTYVVSFRGNGRTSAEGVENFLLRRCADLTLYSGYKYFVVLNGDTSVQSNIIQTPTTVDVNTDSNYQSFGNVNTNFYGNNAYSNFNMTGNGYSNSHATINPGMVHQINHYTSRVILKMYNSNKKFPDAYDARVILSNLQD